MSSYPPPPQPDQQHYNALYPANSDVQQPLLEQAQQEDIQFSTLNQSMYPKVEASNTISSPASQHIQSLAQELQHHAGIDDQRRHHHLNATHQTHQPTSLTGYPSSTSSLHTHTSTPDQASQKTNRLRKACDSCSIRKVKCDEAGPPCRACAALDIPCTFDRPSRRRGPPNRHAEAIKRKRLEDAPSGADSPGFAGTPSPTSPTHAAQALAALSSHSSVPLSAESICPVETLDFLIDDFFTYIHPLSPFPHEPSFREAWKRREDLTNKSFLALLASMIGALVASFPRKPRLQLRTRRKDTVFPNHMGLVQRCQRVCAVARGPAYLESEHLNVYDAATSYFLAMTGIYTFRWHLGRLYFGECLTVLRTLGLHHSKGHSNPQLGTLPMSLGVDCDSADLASIDSHVDCITLEMGRRIFWTMFVNVRSMEQLGADFGELMIAPSTQSKPHPPFPAEVDDFCIYPTHTEVQPPGLIPITSGFNRNIRIHASYDPVAPVEITPGFDVIPDGDRQERALHESLKRCKAAMADLPHELVISSENGFAERQNGNGTIYPTLTHSHFGRDPAASLMNPASRSALESSPEERRRLQYEIQSTNIYCSSLSTRLYIVERYWSLREVHPRSTGDIAPAIDGTVSPNQSNHHDDIEKEMRDEREALVKDLVVALSSIDQMNFEPNADFSTNKTRSLASILLDAPEQRNGPLAREVQTHLRAFLQLLTKLEHDPSLPDANQSQETDPMFRAYWAELEEHQTKFAQYAAMNGIS